MNATAAAPTGAALAERLEQIVLSRIASDQLAIPPPPRVAARCIALTRDPNYTIPKLVSALEEDPVLSAVVLRTANSAAYGGPCPTLAQALQRLGAQRIRTLVTEATARQMFSSKDSRIAGACSAIWDHSRAVALLARDLGMLAGGSAPDEIYLAGLLHDVGKPVIASILLEAERMLRGAWVAADQWIAVVGRCHRPVGVALAEKWNLPPSVSATIRDCSDFDSGNRTAPGNFVCFANALAKSLGIGGEGADLDDANALLMVGRSLLGLDEEVVARVGGEIRRKLDLPPG